MKKQIFPDFRMPAYELPNKSHCSQFPVKLNKFCSPHLQSFISQQPTLTKPIPRISTSCQADVLSPPTQTLEKEISTDPPRQFLEISDIERPKTNERTHYEAFNNPKISANFIQVEEISFTATNPRFRPQTRVSPASSSFKEPSHPESSETSSSHLELLKYQLLKAAKEKVDLLEQEAFRIESDIKYQNEQLDKLDYNLNEEGEKNRKERLIRMIDDVTREEFEESDRDLRIERILEKNKELYGKIQRVFTPKVEEVAINEVKEIDETKILEKGVNPIVNRRIQEAMKTAAYAISLTKGIIMKK